MKEAATTEIYTYGYPRSQLDDRPIFDLFGQRPEGDAAFLEVGDDRQQVRQRGAEPIELPDNQRVAGVHVVEAGSQAGAIVARTGSLVGVEVPLIDTSGRERIALQIDRLCCKNREA